MTDFSLKEYITFFMKRKIFILVITLFFILAGAIFSFIVQKPQYHTETTIKIHTLDFEKDLGLIYGNYNENGAQFPGTNEYVASIFPIIRSIDFLNLLNTDTFKNNVSKQVVDTDLVFNTAYDSASGAITLKTTSSAPFDANKVMGDALNLALDMFESDIKQANAKNVDTLKLKIAEERKKLATLTQELKKSLSAEDKLDKEQDYKISSLSFANLKLAQKKLDFISNYKIKDAMALTYLSDPSQENSLSMSKRLITVIVMAVAGLVISMLCVAVYELWRKIDVNEK